MAVLSPAAPTTPVRTGVWIGIASISMAFAALTSSLLVRQGSGSDWRHVTLPAIIYANTAVLLLSSGTAAMARHRLRVAPAAAPVSSGARAASSAAGWLWLTLVLGVLFISGQIVAWRDLAAQGLFLASSPGSSFFYVFTAIHALHVLGGIAALAYAASRIRSAARRPPDAAVDGAVLYWHFMDVLWLYLLLVLVVRL